MTIGEIIKAYRLEHDMSIRDFGRASGITHAAIALYEKGVSPKTGEPIVPTTSNLKKIADTLGLTLNELLRKCDDMEIALVDAPDYRGSNVRIARLVEAVGDMSNKELDELLSLAKWIKSKR